MEMLYVEDMVRKQIAAIGLPQQVICHIDVDESFTRAVETNSTFIQVKLQRMHWKFNRRIKKILRGISICQWRVYTRKGIPLNRQRLTKRMWLRKHKLAVTIKFP